MLTDSGKIWWARMAIKDTGPWVALAFSYIHISTGNSNLNSDFFHERLLREKFLVKIKYTSIFSHKGTLISIISWGWFPHRQGLSRFWWTDIHCVSRNIPCTSLPPSHISALTKGLPLSFLFHSSWDTRRSHDIRLMKSFILTHERFLHDISWSFATCSLSRFRELLNYSLVGKVCHARLVEAIMQRKSI